MNSPLKGILGTFHSSSVILLQVFVRYTGRLAHNNRIFDSNITSNRHFMFCLGRGEVVKGWDEGIKGMRVGGKRKLSIPPSQGLVSNFLV